MADQIEDLVKLQPVVIKQLQVLYEKNRIAHAYIFEGAKGTGKKNIAMFFVKLLVCQNVSENVPCETCRNCKRVDSGNYPNLLQIEPDGQYIKIDQIRELIGEMTRTGFEEGRKFYIIHHADRLNTSSSNTLLKFLEEPEGEVTAILLTENYQSILPTIQSRCQHIKFSPVPREILMTTLQEQGISLSMASTVSQVTNNLETAIFLAKDEQFAHVRRTVLKLVEAIKKNVHEALFIVYEDWLPSFKEKSDMELALDLLLFAYRDIVTVKSDSKSALVYPDMLASFRELALHSTFDQLSKQMQAILQTRQNLQRNMNRTLMMEQLMLNLQEGYTFV
ncbi:DNA polymerase III subunit delta' [Ureibacillus massiliensis 4400831 = CIP 108448 = CCUG 49529]|uniref:DNA polymerase III subunit delta' n=1 Tax=Ureibacillus massiliensis 4400831 = CIP 108448 = CCUG 49529 TaxID=1211035 RepID=A0A0A3J0E1_9BACL|nr:DNA polymerase III subunit delta' [Ureibacillus massiliensis]KGR89170.1 DNA polymerase III subunit delta' [Ureibacillus massiliensis 4400831 = CIP 108448 = CCUG 49529]RKJ66870.1 DNA polymerase III subunit delta' [Butyricicoccus sp. 1XD8-22]